MVAPGPWRGSCVLMLLGSGETTKDQPVHKSTEHQILRLTRMLMTASDYEASVNRALREIGNFLPCDRVYIFENRETGFLIPLSGAGKGSLRKWEGSRT